MIKWMKALVFASVIATNVFADDPAQQQPGGDEEQGQLLCFLIPNYDLCLLLGCDWDHQLDRCIE